MEKKTNLSHNSAISPFPAVQISFFSSNFSPMENGYLRACKIFPSVEIGKKAEHTIIYFSPPPPSDSLVCIYGGGPLCLKSSQPSLLLARHAEYGGKHKVSE